jgi:predicted MFS family arabinose efflux permease
MKTQAASVAGHDNWAAIYAAGLSTFAVVTTEMLPVGLMTPIAETLDTSVGSAGLMISIPAILAAFFAPFVVLAAGTIDRRNILAGLLVLLIAANLASALAPSIAWLLAARVIVGLCMGGIWAIAGGLAPRLGSGTSIGTATAVIFGGVAAASVLGVPFGAIIGDFMNWRWAFGAMAGFSGVVLALSWWAMPPLPINNSVKIGQFQDQLARPAVRWGLLLTLLAVAGHFMAYTFVRPLLQSVSGVSLEWIGLLLFIYGAAGIVGNFLAGAMASKRLELTLTAIAFALTASIIGMVLFGNTPVGGAGLLVFWGLAYGGVSVSLQTWMMKAAPAAIEIVTALFVSIFNIGIAVGSFAGGQVVDHFGLDINLTVAATLPAMGLLVALTMGRN